MACVSKYSSITLHTSIPNPQTVNTEGNDRTEVEEGADAMQAPEPAVECLHLSGNLHEECEAIVSAYPAWLSIGTTHTRLIVGFAFLLLKPMALEHDPTLLSRTHIYQDR